MEIKEIFLHEFHLKYSLWVGFIACYDELIPAAALHLLHLTHITAFVHARNWRYKLGHASIVITKWQYSPNSTWLVTPRLNTTPHVRRVEPVEPCCSTSSTQPKFMGSTHRTCRVVSRRDEPSGIWAYYSIVLVWHFKLSITGVGCKCNLFINR